VTTISVEGEQILFRPAIERALLVGRADVVAALAQHPGDARPGAVRVE